MYQVFAFAAADLDFDPEGPGRTQAFREVLQSFKIK